MNFVCIGGDRRQTETALYLKKLGHNVTIFGLPKNDKLSSSNNLYQAISENDIVVLPLPVSRDGVTVNTPLTSEIIFLQDILLCRPKFIFGGIIKDDFISELKCREIPFYDYYNSEALTVKNAVLTAEAAIAIAINCTDFSIFGSKSLVLGYGRIGRYLCKYLKALGSTVTATSRNSGTLAIIEADGHTAINTAKITSICDEFDYIFNTAPSPIIDQNFIKRIKHTAFVEDLATDSGIDLAAANTYCINANVYSGLPGKHSPVSAAQFVAEEILSYIENGGIYA